MYFRKVAKRAINITYHLFNERRKQKDWESWSNLIGDKLCILYQILGCKYLRKVIKSFSTWFC